MRIAHIRSNFERYEFWLGRNYISEYNVVRLNFSGLFIVHNSLITNIRIKSL